MKGLTISGALKKLDSGEITAVELAESYLDESKKRNTELNAFLEIYDDVVEQARLSDKRRQEGKAGVLEGIPIALKDNILVKDKRASAASKILENYRAPYSSTVAERLLNAGAILLGRTNMDEFAMGSSTENSAYGVVSHPFDFTRVPGGSSGGSAAVVAADMALVSLGSETGGSVRQPAAFCGLVGFKPTYGAVSRYGLMALGSSLDQISPFGRTVADAETLFDVIHGEDPMDMTSIPHSLWDKKSVEMKDSLKGLKVGVPWGFIEREGMDPDVLSSFKNTLDLLEKEGAQIIPLELPATPFSLACYYIILPAEISSNLARYDGVKYGLHVSGENGIDDYFKTRAQGFGPESRRRIILGTYVLSAGYYDSYYGKALEARDVISTELARAFQEVDVIATPTTPTPAFKKGEKSSDPLAMYLSDIFTVPANIAGIPAISIPTDSVEREGVSLPLGFQLMGPHMSDKSLFSTAKLVERAYGRG